MHVKYLYKSTSIIYLFNHSRGFYKMLAKTRVTTATTVRTTKRGFQIWIEGAKLSSHGFNTGAKYTLEMDQGVIT